MKVVTVAAPKGGSGKTTLVSALAARAALESARVAMFDLNSDQANLTQWYILRGEPPNPVLVEVEKIGRDVEVLRAEKFEWRLIDTPPLDLDVIEAAVAVADAVIAPSSSKPKCDPSESACVPQALSLRPTSREVPLQSYSDCRRRGRGRRDGSAVRARWGRRGLDRAVDGVV